MEKISAYTCFNKVFQKNCFNTEGSQKAKEIQWEPSCLTSANFTLKLHTRHYCLCNKELSIVLSVKRNSILSTSHISNNPLDLCPTSRKVTHKQMLLPWSESPSQGQNNRMDCLIFQFVFKLRSWFGFSLASSKKYNLFHSGL